MDCWEDGGTVRVAVVGVGDGRVRKFETTVGLDTRSENYHACFFINTAEDFLKFMSNSSNYEVDLHSRELILIWKATAC